MMITSKFLSFLQSFLFLIFLIVLINGSHSHFAGGAKCREVERVALLQFKAEMIDEYGRLSSWGSTTNCCEWKGVVCDNQTNHVVALDLHGYGDRYAANAPLRGKISPSLLQLPHLQYLDLSLNSFSYIPKFIDSLSKLQHLNLSSCNLFGPIPHHIGNLSSLRILDLGGNSWLTDTNLDWLSGSPSLQYLDLSLVDLGMCTTWLQAIHKLTALKQLHLSHCILTTFEPFSVPSHNSSNSLAVLDLSSNYLFSPSAIVLSWFLNMSSSFTYIDLSDNYLEGSIPVALGNLMSLSHLDLRGTSLRSSIPDALGNLTSLSHLDLSYNQLQGEFPRPSKNSSSLSYLDLSLNKLNGQIPHFLSWLHGSTRLEYLYVSDNVLSGSFPNMSIFSLLRELHLDYNRLNGTLLEDNLRLPYLEILDLSKNNFTRFFQGNLRLPNLEYIDLSRNMFTGILPDSLRLPNLKYLDLSTNDFTGILPGNLTLPNLEYLDLSTNKFMGRLPNLSSCLALRVLNLSDNTFNGSLIESIGNHLSKIEYLLAGYNKLEGVITEAHLSSFPHLACLDLSFNFNITLRISSSWLHPVQFSELHLAYCKLGPVFPKWLQKQNHLEFLDISNSRIFDTIPGWFIGIISVCKHLNMSHNQIYGIFPNLSSEFVDLKTIDLSSNEFTGSLPHLPSLVYNIDFSKNSFSGTILNFCHFKDLGLMLDLSNNLLSGDIPQDCFMNLSSLPYLNLVNNNFFGDLPTSNSACSLSSLHLRNNSFSGEIPRSLMNCSELRILDLGENEFSGRIPMWLGESMPDLGVLILKSNMLNGSLPSSICHLANLQVLDISSNKIKGTIPYCINNFTLLRSERFSDSWNRLFSLLRNASFDSLYYDSASVIWKGNEETYINTLGLLKMIDLSSNELTGEIPRELTSLFGLVGLNLSRNNLVGFIPQDIDQMKQLNFLDLSRNNLSGGIPTTLSKLSHLGVLNLSFNNFSGRIPWDTHMETFGALTYLGNPRLCGLPLVSRPCPEDEKPKKRRNETGDSEDEDKLISRGFYISMVLGFCVAFWVVFWTLFVNKWWNVTTMKIYITVGDWLYVNILVNKRRLLWYFTNA